MRELEKLLSGSFGFTSIFDAASFYFVKKSLEKHYFGGLGEGALRKKSYKGGSSFFFNNICKSKETPCSLILKV